MTLTVPPAPGGDRIEHGSVVPTELHDQIARHGLTVVTQPTFVAERGDEYLADVDAEDRPFLYPCRSLLDAGIAVGAGTDAPFGDPDPWHSVAAAVRRRTRTGSVLGPDEAISPRRALDLLLGPPGSPGGPIRRVVPGAPADLCLLDGGLRQALAEPAAERVVATIVGGRTIHRRPDF